MAGEGLEVVMAERPSDGVRQVSATLRNSHGHQPLKTHAKPNLQPNSTLAYTVDNP